MTPTKECQPREEIVSAAELIARPIDSRDEFEGCGGIGEPPFGVAARLIEESAEGMERFNRFRVHWEAGC